MEQSGATTSRVRWELENNVQNVPAAAMPNADALLAFDAQQQSVVQQQRPWSRDPQYFKHVKMSALALLKITMHAKSGGRYEVMGMMQGKTIGDTFIVVDSFALPVEGTETRVNAQESANEYLIDFLHTNKDVSRLENIVGWYHSHPGYGCWLSGIDVGTQMTNQTYQEPFLAVVIDPVKTMAAGKVEIGAFRTYPEHYKPPDEGPEEYQSIPLDKIEDFGVHAKKYYSLDISFFKTSVDSHLLDLLWNKYWAATLSSSPLVTQRAFISGQIRDIADKLEQAESHVAQTGRIGRYLTDEKRREEDRLTKICHDITNLTTEEVKGLTAQVIKDMLFNCTPMKAAAAAPSVDDALMEA